MVHFCVTSLAPSAVLSMHWNPEILRSATASPKMTWQQWPLSVNKALHACAKKSLFYFRFSHEHFPRTQFPDDIFFRMRERALTLNFTPRAVSLGLFT